VPLDKPVKSRDLEINFTNQILKIGLKGEEPIVQVSQKTALSILPYTYALFKGRVLLKN
jgi:hypothetical protein